MVSPTAGRRSKAWRSPDCLSSGMPRRSHWEALGISDWVNGPSHIELTLGQRCERLVAGTISIKTEVLQRLLNTWLCQWLRHETWSSSLIPWLMESSSTPCLRHSKKCLFNFMQFSFCYTISTNISRHFFTKVFLINLQQILFYWSVSLEMFNGKTSNINIIFLSKKEAYSSLVTSSLLRIHINLFVWLVPTLNMTGGNAQVTCLIKKDLFTKIHDNSNTTQSHWLWKSTCRLIWSAHWQIGSSRPMWSN